MARICFVFLVITAALEDPFYELAMEKLKNPGSGSIESLISHLETSAALFNPLAFSKLGQLWLFGFKDVNNHLQRNLTKALEYFTEGSSLNDGDSQFYIDFLSRDSQFNPDLESVPDIQGREQLLKGLLNFSKKPSGLYKASFLASYLQSNNIKSLPLPSFLSQNDAISDNLVLLRKTDQGLRKAYMQMASVEARLALDYIESLTVDYKFQSIEIELENPSRESTHKLVSLLSKSSELHLDAQGFYLLGDLYLRGDEVNGILPNKTKAIEYYKRSSALNHPTATAMLARIYTNGQGVPETNRSLALDYTNKAIAMGAIDAYIPAFHIFRSGIGAEKDLEKAVQYLKLAADSGITDSYSPLGAMYMNGEGVEKNSELALNYMLMAASHGSYSAKFNLAQVLLEGRIIPQSNEKALRLFMEIISKARSEQFMIDAYKSFKDQDFQGAFLNYLAAASVGNSNALLSLAYLVNQSLVGSRKGEKEYREVVYLVQALAIDLNKKAFEKLGKITYNGSDREPANYTLAYEYFVRADISPEAIYYLAYMIEQGLGCEKNYEKALRMYDSIITRAHREQVTHLAAYPAILGKLRVQIKNFLEEYLPISIEL